MMKFGISMAMSLMPGLAMRETCTLVSSKALNISGLLSNVNQQDNLRVSIIWMVGLSIAVGAMFLSFLLMHWFYSCIGMLRQIIKVTPN